MELRVSGTALCTVMKGLDSMHHAYGQKLYAMLPPTGKRLAQLPNIEQLSQYSEFVLFIYQKQPPPPCFSSVCCFLKLICNAFTPLLSFPLS